jgi:hypothetical protein
MAITGTANRENPKPPSHEALDRPRSFMDDLPPAFVELLEHDQLIMGEEVSVAAPKKYPDGLRARAVGLCHERCFWSDSPDLSPAGWAL